MCPAIPIAARWAGTRPVSLVLVTTVSRYRAARPSMICAGRRSQAADDCSQNPRALRVTKQTCPASHGVVEPPCQETRRRRTWRRVSACDRTGRTALPEVLQLGQLGERRSDPRLLPAEVDDHGDVFLDPDHPAEAVAVMRHLVTRVVVLDGRRRGGIIERTSWQVAPGHGACWAHDLQYAPAALIRRAAAA